MEQHKALEEDIQTSYELVEACDEQRLIAATPEEKQQLTAEIQELWKNINTALQQYGRIIVIQMPTVEIPNNIRQIASLTGSPLPAPTETPLPLPATTQPTAEDENSWLTELPDTQYFVGREPELTKLQEATVNADAKVIIIRGLAGIGKKYLVSECLSRCVEAEQLTAKHIRVLACKHYPSKEGFFPRLATLLNIDLTPTQWDATIEKDALLTELLQAMRATPFTIVFTHFESLLKSASRKKVSGFPIDDYWVNRFFSNTHERHHQSKIIITTTDEPIFDGSTTYLTRITSAKHSQIKGFNLDSTATFLNRGDVNLARADLRKINNAVQGHPLALSWIYGMLQGGFDVAEIFELPGLRIQFQLERLLRTVYDLCTPQEKELMGFLSTYRKPIPVKALDGLTLSNEADASLIQHLHDLRNRSLIFRSREQKLYTLHSIVRLFCYEKNDTDIRKQYHAMAAQWYNQSQASSSRYRRRDRDITTFVEAHYHFEEAGKRKSALNILRDKIIPVWNNIHPRYHNNRWLEKCADSYLEAIEILQLSIDYNPDMKHKYGTLCTRYADVALRLGERLTNVFYYLDEALNFAPDEAKLYDTYSKAIAKQYAFNDDFEELNGRFEGLVFTLEEKLEQSTQAENVLRKALAALFVQWANYLPPHEKKELLQSAQNVFAHGEPPKADVQYYRNWFLAEKALAKAEHNREVKRQHLETALEVLNKGLTHTPKARILLIDKAITLRQLNNLETDQNRAIHGYDQAIQILEALQIETSHKSDDGWELAQLYFVRAERSGKLSQRLTYLHKAEAVLRGLKRHPNWDKEHSLLYAKILFTLSQEESYRNKQFLNEAITILKKEMDKQEYEPKLLWRYTQSLLRQPALNDEAFLPHLRQVIQLVRALLKKQPNAEGFYCLAYLFRRRAYIESELADFRKWTDSAERCLENALRLGKTPAIVYAEYGRLHRERAQKEDGQKPYKRNVKIAREYYEKALNAADIGQYPWIYRSAAVFYRAIWDYEAACTCILQYLELEPNAYQKMKACSTYAGIVVHYVREFEEEEKLKTLTEARLLCEEAQEVLEDDALFLTSYARILFELGDEMGAIDRFKQLFVRPQRLGADFPSWHEEMLEVSEDGSETWAQILGGAPGDPRVWSSFGTFLKDCYGDFTAAEKAYKNGLFLDKNDHVVLTNLALLIIDSGQVDRYLEAEQYLHQAMQLSQGKFKWAYEHREKLKQKPEYQALKAQQKAPEA